MEKTKITTMITQEIINRNKDHYINFFYEEILLKVKTFLSDYDFELDKTEFHLEFILVIENISLDVSIYSAKYARRNKYTFDGELIGRSEIESDHEFEFSEISIHPLFWCEDLEDWFDLSIAEEINSKLFELDKM